MTTETNSRNRLDHRLSPENIPERFKKIPAFMGTILEPKENDKVDKPPYRIRPGCKPIKADPTDPKNWSAYEEVLAAYESGDIHAFGFVFSEEDPFTVIDQDEVIDAETGEIKPNAAEIVRDFPTYWETSLSGNGLHGICVGTKPGTRCKKGDVEIYDGRRGARFVVLTGNSIGSATATPREIRDCQKQIDALYKRTFGADPKTTPRERSGASPWRSLEPGKLLEKARKSRSGKKFAKLFDQGDRSDYPGNSEADMGLLNMLAFWCSGDADYMEEMFRRSALYRPKDKHAGYVRISVNNCLRAYKGGFYTPQRVKEQPKQKQDDVLAPYLASLADPSQWKGQKEATAYKAYAALVIMAVEDGISTGLGQDVLRIGADVRRLAERCGANRVTLQRSTLPYLWKERRLIEWRPGKGRQAGEFILKKPKLTLEATNKEVHEAVHNFIGSTWSESLNALAQVIRMRPGVSHTGKISELGKFETVSRLGPVAMFCMVALLTSKNGLSLDEATERTGRRKDNVRRVMRKLVDAEIAVKSSGDFFALAPDFWKAYKRSLIKTGIRRAEVRQKQAHDRERRERDRKLAGKKPKRFAQKVVDMDARRREKEDREALRRQFMEHQDVSTLTPAQLEEKLGEVLMDSYEEMVRRCMERLGSRSKREREGAS